MPTIVALVKHVPDTWSTKTLDSDHTLNREAVDNMLDEINEYSVEQALRLKEANPEFQVVALTVGPASADEALRKALAMGADDAVHVQDDALAGSDALATTWAIHNAINAIAAKHGSADLVVMGNTSTDGSTSLLAGMLAEYRQAPALTNVLSVNIAGGKVTGTREDADGHWELSASLPAIVSVTDKADQPRFPNFKGLMAAKKHDVTVWSIADIGVEAGNVGLAASTTAVTAAAEKPARTAGDVIDSGSPEEMAAKVADFLASKNLI